LGRLLAILATLLIILLGAAFVVPAFTDWNAYRPDIEQAASAILGRQINIIGEIDIALLPEPHLHASKVAAADGAGDGATMSAEAVDLSLSLQALLSGRLEANKLKLLRPVLTLDFSKPLLSHSSETETGDFSIAAGVNSIEIEDGRVSVFSKDYGGPDALALTKIDGTISAPSSGNAYRFGGRVWQKDRQLDVKFSAASSQDGQIKLTGNISDIASKTVLQADGFVNAAGKPVFDGAVSLSAPQSASLLTGIPFELQLKSNARIDLAGVSLGDLVLTLDPQNRPQILAGSADIAFVARTANITLQARSLDADALLTSATEQGAAKVPQLPGGWSGLRSAAADLLWFYPHFAVRLAFAADQLQLKGELIEGVKVEGARTSQQWVFERVLAILPGETAVKLAGTFTSRAGKSRTSGTVAITGKNLGRLSRWVAPDAKAFPAKAFSMQGSVMLSGDTAAFEGVAGSVEGVPFSGNLHLDRTPVRKIQLSLTADSFDVSSLETSQPGADALSADSLSAAWQAGAAQLTALLDEEPRGFDTADIDVSAATVRTSFAEAKDLAVHLKFNQDLLTILKLNVGTSDGLTLKGEGVVPLRGTGQGRFDGRLEAKSAQAVLQAAAFAGFDAESFGGRRPEDFAPAALWINYGSDMQAGTATAQLGGNLGTARMEGRAQLKGTLADWKAGLLSAQFGISAPDGNKLLALLFPKADLAPSASVSAGTITVRVNGASQKFETSGTLKAGTLQVQLDGATEIKAKTFAFNGRASAASQTPEQFLPATLLALLGGEPKSNLRIDANLMLTPSHLEADKLRAEAPNNLVTGHLLLDTAGSRTLLDADVKADQISLPALFSYFLVPPPADRTPLMAPASLAAPLPGADIWSGRPFALSTFQDAAGKVSVGAKTMRVSDGIVLSDAQLSMKLEKARLEIQRLEGKALGGDLSASASLDALGTGVGVHMRVALSNADLSMLPSPGTPSIATGKASLFLSMLGQGLSPRGLISVLQGRGMIALSDGQLAKFSPAAVQKSADDMLTLQHPLTEDTITKKVLEASQSSDFRFRRLKIPVMIHDGMLEIRRASFRNRDGTVRMEAYLDLANMHADSTWQAGVIADRRAKWPPVKIMVSGALRELGARPRTLAAEDFVRALLVRKMEGDMTRLEGLNRQQGPAPAWTATQEPAPKPSRRRKRDEDATQAAPAPTGASASGPAGKGPVSAGTPNFEARMRDALQSGGAGNPGAR
jgi:uncharacterized protein involved in outer membrane biogenesis